MSNQGNNIHDENFKHNFKKLEVARAFFKHNLPKKVLEKIDLNTLQVENNEFLASKHRGGRRADIVYSVKDKQSRKLYLILHLEAQGKHDESMPIRVWEYQLAIAKEEFQKRSHVPLILTFVLYHGEKEWTSPKSIAEIFDDFDLYVDVALRAPFLINLSKADIETLKRQEAAAAPQMIMKGQTEGDYCPMLKDLYTLMKKYDQLDEENLDYITCNESQEPDVFLKELSKFDPETANKYKTMFQAAIQREVKKEVHKEVKKAKTKALELGLIKGKQEGRQEGKIEIAKHMLAERLDRYLISKVTGLTLPEIATL